MERKNNKSEGQVKRINVVWDKLKERIIKVSDKKVCGINGKKE